MTAGTVALPAALLFDVFGTLVDWRSGVIEALEDFALRQGVTADWAAFADDWRAAYGPSMDRVRHAEVAWQNLDSLHRASLGALLERYGMSPIADAESERLVRAWHVLTPWPDVVAGMQRLRRRFILATLSNGHIALQVDLCRHAGLPFDMLFSAELFGHYKPDAQTYLGACALLDLPPGQVMLVAAHRSDLHAARSLGLQTAFLARPHEFGSAQPAATAPADGTDYHVTSLEMLAQTFGA